MQVPNAPTENRPLPTPRPGRVTVSVPPRESFWNRVDPWRWYQERIPAWVAFFLPIVLVPIPILLALIEQPEVIPKLWLIQLLTLLALDVAIVSGLLLNLHWWVVLSVILWMEFLLLVWLVRNLEIIRRWPPANRFLQRREARALRMYQQRTWIRRLHFWGIVAITFLPFGTGIWVSTFVGKVTGMSDRVLIGAVYFGTVLWSAFVTWVFAFSIEFAQPWIEKVL